MLTTRNLVTVVLLIAVAGLGWLGGSHFAHDDDHGHQARQPSAQTAGSDDDKGHAGHAHERRPAPGEICPEHRLPESEDVLCNPQLMSALLPGEGARLRLATPEAASRIGVDIAPARPAGVAGGPAVPAQVSYNRGRLAEVTALAGGMVQRVIAEAGQPVARGGLLAEIASPLAAAARADYQAALGRLELAEANARREQMLVDKGISARIDLDQALAEQRAARAAVDQLREQLAAFGADMNGSGGRLLAVRSRLAGTVVARHAVAGQTLAPETPLFTVADLSSMWLEMQLSAAQAVLAQAGATVEAEFDGLPDRRFTGTIVQVDAGLDERTRLLKVVAEVANPDRLLKDGMFGQARLQAGGSAPVAPESPSRDRGHRHSAESHRNDHDDHDEHDSHDDHGDDHAGMVEAVTVAVPAGAVQTIDGKAYVFVALEQDLFELRRVEAGPRLGAEVLLTAGLRPGERVAASQGFALKSELLKSRLGASCADH